MEASDLPRGLIKGRSDVEEARMTKPNKSGVSRRSTLALMGAGAVTFATPWVARAQAKSIKIGMPTILSGRVAQLGTSSRNGVMIDRKSTRLNSSHQIISYAVFCLKKKKPEVCN